MCCSSNTFLKKNSVKNTISKRICMYIIGWIEFYRRYVLLSSFFQTYVTTYRDICYCCYNICIYVKKRVSCFIQNLEKYTYMRTKLCSIKMGNKRNYRPHDDKRAGLSKICLVFLSHIFIHSTLVAQFNFNY